FSELSNFHCSTVKIDSATTGQAAWMRASFQSAVVHVANSSGPPAALCSRCETGSPQLYGEKIILQNLGLMLWDRGARRHFVVRAAVEQSAAEVLADASPLFEEERHTSPAALAED